MTRPLLTVLASAVLLAAAGPAGAQAPAASAPAAAPMPAPAAAPMPAPAPAAAPQADADTGKIAWYGPKFNGRKTASGERFNAAALTMAHKSLPFGTRVKVTNVKNGRSVVVRVNDRGPTAPDRIGDVSLAAAQKLRMTKSGVVDAKLEVVGQAPARKAKA